MLTFKLRAILAFLAGLALTLSYAPFNLWFLSPILLAGIFYLSAKQSIKQQTQLGFLFGLGWFSSGISWVHVSISDYGGLPLIASILLMVCLSAYLALYPMLCFWLNAKIIHITKRPQWFLASFLPLFALCEMLRGTLLTGFPWLSLGYTLTDSPLNLFAPIIGEFGLSLVVIIIAYSLYLLTQKQWRQGLGLTTIYLSAFAFCHFGMSPMVKYQNKSIDVLLVQGNIKQELRWAPEQFWPTMSKYQDMTRRHWNVDLVVWPEAAIPEVEYVAGDFLSHLDSAASFNDTALITGIVDYQFDTKAIYNNLVVVGKQQAQDTQGHYQYLHKNRYRKSQLLPIGEFVPFEELLRPIAPLFDLPMSSFSRGDRVQNNLIANGYHILPAICYEIVFSDLVRANYRPESDILFTVSNDAWFGRSHGPHQHMQIARMRALELGMPLVRVTNNGISGVYDPISQQSNLLPQFESSAKVVPVKLIDGQTIYADYGNKPAWLILSLLALAVLIQLIRTKKGR